MAVTTIPWGDGSGDNIYLTYSSESGNQTVEVTSDANTGSANRSKNITFASVVGNITKVLTVSQEGKPEEYIIFADPAVEQICATNWGDGVGLKPSQAARVTNNQLGSTFKNNTQIVSFDELRYFTSITEIGREAFSGCSALVSITFSESIRSLGYRAFYNCISLEDVTCLSSTLGLYRSFQGCTAMSKVHVPSLYAYLGYTFNSSSCGFFTSSKAASRGLYDGDTLIQQLTIPSDITTLQNYAFYNINEFTSISLPSTLTRVMTYTFGNCKFASAVSVTLPNSLTTIDGNAFNGTNMEIYVDGLPLVTTINGSVFRSSGIKELVLSSITTFGNSAVFSAASLTKIDLPSTLTSISGNFCRDCRHLEVVVVRATSVPSTSSSNFMSSVPATAKIYVPYSSDHSILNAYKAASGWSSYASYIYELNQDGTIPS